MRALPDLLICTGCLQPVIGEEVPTLVFLGEALAHRRCHDKWFSEHRLDPSQPEPPHARLLLFYNLLEELREGIRPWSRLAHHERNELLDVIDSVFAGWEHTHDHDADGAPYQGVSKIELSPPEPVGLPMCLRTLVRRVAARGRRPRHKPLISR